MTSSLWRFGITLAFLGFASILPWTSAARALQLGDILVTDLATHAVLVVDPSSGAQSVLTSGDLLSRPEAVAVNSAGEIFVVEGDRFGVGSKIVRVDPKTGAQALVASGGNLFDPHDVAIESTGMLVIADFTGPNGYGGIIRINPANGAQSVVFENHTLSTPFELAVETSGDIVVASRNAFGSPLFRVHPATATETLLNSDVGFTAGVAVESSGSIVVADEGAFGGPSHVYRVDPVSGARTTVITGASFLLDIAVRSDGQIFVIDGTSIVQVDPVLGTRHTVSSGGNFVDPGGLTFFGSAPTPIVMAFDFTPNTLNLSSRGLWVTGYLEPASPFAASDIDISSIRLNGTIPVDPTAPTELGDHNGNTVPDLMVKFNRRALELTLPGGDSIEVVVTGTLGGHSFIGADRIRIRRAVVSAPVAGSHLTAGSVTQVRWETPSDVTVQSVDVLHSFDDGSNWSLIAHGEPNTGSYDWTVPNVQSDQARVAVVLVESVDEAGTIVDGVLGVSDGFAIDAPLGVGDRGPIELALRGVTPNPALNELRVSFSLRDSKAATLALFDVSGRQLAARRVDGMGPGWHAVTLGGQTNLPTGLYVIRLTQDGRSLTTRAAVVR